jgi:glucosamine-6-phosphate deaminase
MTVSFHAFSSADALGDVLAGRIMERIEGASAEGRRFLLGCPTGRTPRPCFSEMARRVAAAPRDLSHLVLVMMDEYLVPGERGLVWASAERPWSCHHFARHEIAGPLNESLPEEWRVREVWFPDPNDPEEYDRRIDAAGGVDLFLLASGASDGHVAFNPPGSPRDSRTRVIPLSDSTRQDNLATFPAFGTLDAVPHHGVSVGVDTICRAKEAIMLVTGESKRETLRRMRAATGYEPDWPATLIHECRTGEILADRKAAG